MSASTRCSLLLVALTLFSPALSGLPPIPTGPQSFIINGVAYPAGNGFEAVYIVTSGPFEQLEIVCNHSLVDVGAQWFFQSPMYDGPGTITQGFVPNAGEPVPVVQGPPGATLFYAEGDTLFILNPTREVQGLFTCALFSLRIQLAFDNPYVDTGFDLFLDDLVDTLPVRAVTLYSEDGSQAPPPVEDVTIFRLDNSNELPILSAQQGPSNPYQTIYEVARPQSLVRGDIVVEVNINGMTANDTLYFEINDFYEGLMEVTVVNEGDEVLFNCTPTFPGANSTFSGPSALLELFPPSGNIWMFLADVIFSGLSFSCSVQNVQFEITIMDRTLLFVYPESVESDVVFSRESGSTLPNGYILLNDVRAEGLIFICATRSGTVSLLSENETITELYATVDNGDSFYVGEDEINVNRGDRFIRVEMTVEQDYGDVLTCISDETSDTATLRIIPDSTYISVFPEDRTSAVVDYLRMINLTFTYVAFSPSRLLLDGDPLETMEFSDPKNDQISIFPIKARQATMGEYMLLNIEQSIPNATFYLNVTLPVLTISPESVVVSEGGDFELLCTSSIPDVPVEWSFRRESFTEPNITVTDADEFYEGVYLCFVAEDGLNVASTSAFVEIITNCPEHYAGGILWSLTPENQLAFVPCREADSRFSAAVSVSRVCGPGGFWSDPNFSGCTLSSSEEQRFIIFSLYYELFGETAVQSLMPYRQQIQLQLDFVTSLMLPEFPFSSLEIVPGIASILLDGVSMDTIRMRYTISYNTSSNTTFNEEHSFVARSLSADLHCNNPISIEDEFQGFTLGPIPFEGDTFGFQRADICECIPTGISIPGNFPPDDLIRKRGLQCTPSFFSNFQQTCSGTTAGPCACLLPGECQCTTPYVGNGQFCVLDEDGDSYPALIPEVICDRNNTSSYCMLDSCPSVPNTDPADNTPCEGFPSLQDPEFCAEEADDEWNIQWPFLLSRDSVTVPCGVNYTGNATRECGSNGDWGEPDVSLCSSLAIMNVQLRIALLVGDTDEVDTGEVLEVFEELVEATEEPLFPVDVDTTIEDVTLVLDLLDEERMDGGGDVQLAMAIFEVLDNLLVEDNLESFDILEDTGASQRVLDNVERYALYVARVLQDEGMNIIINITGENIVLRAQSVMLGGMEDEGYVFPDEGEVMGLDITNGSTASVSLPQSLLESRSTGGSVGVASVLFRNLQAFLPNDSEATTPRSLVISSQVAEGGGNGEIDPVLEENPVIITFSFEVAENEEIAFDDIGCVFWDLGGDSTLASDSELVRWSTDGLRTESVTREGNTVTVTCTSTHLTSFAVLVDVGGARIESEALKIVSYIGLAISLACLLLTIIFFLTFGKKLFTAVHNFLHLNLAIALFCGYLVFAVGIEQANHEKIPCNVVTALIQYFLLSAFCWMMCEGVMLYLMLVVVFSTLSKKWWFFFLLGWGIPLIFVIIGLGAVHDEYGVKDDSSNSDDYYKYCWLSSGEGTYAIWTFVAPMLAIILINTVFLVLVLYRIAKSRTNRQKKVDDGYRVDVVTTVIKASVILLPLLGLTWVFGLFAVNENTIVFAWLFTIFNSLQGLFIFIFHVLRNDRIWGTFKKRYDAYSTSRASKSTSSTAVKSSKYHSVGTSSTGGDMELKEKSVFVDPEASSEVKTALDEEPTKHAVA